jgi:tRNA pseudouridine55 synthase
MARRGADISGWVILDKPAGMGSTPAVALVRRAFGAAKAGHAGTLDPDATGVLAIALGEATKTVGVVEGALKAYRFAVRWGAETTTDDAAGAVLDRAAVRPDRAAILAALPALRGEILQVPPAVSAVKVAGERAYDLTRAGTPPELAPRPLLVARLDLVDEPDADTAIFEMTCGKGGYVRAIARDLGRALGCLGHALWLRRIWSGPFRIDEAVSPEAVAADPGACLRPVEAGLAGLPRADCPAALWPRLSQGNPVPMAGSDGGRLWVAHHGQVVALGHIREGIFHPDRMLKPSGAVASGPMQD